MYPQPTQLLPWSARLLVLTAAAMLLACAGRPSTAGSADHDRSPVPRPPSTGPVAPGLAESISTVPVASTSSPAANRSAAGEGTGAVPPSGAQAASIESHQVTGRRYWLAVPATPTRRPPRPRPLVVFLHGLGASGKLLLDALELPSLAATRDMLLAAPDGRADSTGRRFWNGTDACCDFENTRSADADFIGAVLDDVRSQYSVARDRVFLVGYSNGAFMAHRAACDLSDRIAGIATFSGAGWAAPGRCRPTSAVTVLQVHGDADEIVAYGGGPLLGRVDRPHQPGAPATARAWAQRNRCDRTATAATRGMAISGHPVTRRAYGSCPGSAVELWTVHGGGHRIGMQSGDVTAALDMLMSHPKELRDDRPTPRP